MSELNQLRIGSNRFLSFLTVMLILTLDANNGKDMLDVLVPYIESLTIVNLGNH
ncbi:MAG: hypothetical protein GY714_01735 [Desulfobacterales bacterium]|nr:hypothetical protein [Desulfobacterales bacterium]